MILESIANLIEAIAKNGASVASREGWYEPKVPEKLINKEKEE